MNFYLKKLNHITQEKLRKLKSNSPKEKNITLDSLYKFFKDLNNHAYYNDDIEFINIYLSDDDEILNCPITEQEIWKCIKSLKNNFHKIT